MHSRLVSFVLILGSLIFFSLLTKSLYLLDPPVWTDEAIITDASIQLLKTGRIATNLFGDTIAGTREHFYFYPPFYFYVLASWIAAFGASLEAVRALSVVLSVGTLFLFWLIVKRLYNSSVLASFGLLLLSLDSSFGTASRTARPELLVLFFFHVSLYLFLIGQKKKGFVWYVVSGISASFAFMAHQLGLLVPAVMCIFVFCTKAPRRTTVALLAAVLLPTVIFFSVWMSSVGLSAFIEQQRLQFEIRSVDQPYLFLVFMHDTYWKIALIFMSTLVLIFAVLVLRFKKYFDAAILLSFAFTFLLLLVGKTGWYTVYLVPFEVLIIISLIQKVRRVRHLFRVPIVCLLTGAVIMEFVLTYTTTVLLTSKRFSYHSYVSAIKNNIPKGSSVFLASVPDPYFDLRNDPSLELYEVPPVYIPEENYLRLLSQMDSVVYNLAPNAILESYITKNQKGVVSIGLLGDPYQTDIVTLRRNR